MTVTSCTNVPNADLSATIDLVYHLAPEALTFLVTSGNPECPNSDFSVKLLAQESGLDDLPSFIEVDLTGLAFLELTV